MLRVLYPSITKHEKRLPDSRQPFSGQGLKHTMELAEFKSPGCVPSNRFDLDGDDLNVRRLLYLLTKQFATAYRCMLVLFFTIMNYKLGSWKKVVGVRWGFDKGQGAEGQRGGACERCEAVSLSTGSLALQ